MPTEHSPAGSTPDALPATRQLLVLGDSHALVFATEHMKRLLPYVDISVVSVGGATVSGLENPNSVTQAMPQFKAALAETSARTVVVMLGEVDTGFVIWYRAARLGASVDAMLAQALANYERFLTEIAARFDVICISTPLPTIQDGAAWGEVANLRKEVKASLGERTALTRRFNDAVQAICARHGLDYLHLDAESVDEQGRLKRGLLNADPSDHHYNALAHAELIAPRLAPLVAPAYRRAGEGRSSATSRNAQGWRARWAGALRRLLVR